MPGRPKPAPIPDDDKSITQLLGRARQCNAQGQLEVARLHCLAAFDADPRSIDAPRQLLAAAVTCGLAGRPARAL